MPEIPVTQEHALSEKRDKPIGVALSSVIKKMIWLCMLPLLVFAVGIAIYQIKIIERQLVEQAAVLAENFVLKTDNSVSARISALNMLAASPLIDDQSRWNELYQEAKGFHASFGTHVVITDGGTPVQLLMDTRVPFGAALPVVEKPNGRLAGPIAMRTGKPAVSDLFFGPVANKPLLGIAVPVLREGKARYAILTTIAKEFFQTRIEQFSLPSGWTVVLRDAEGETIARLPENFVEPSFKAHVASSRISHWTVTVGIPQYAYLSPLINTGIAVGVALFGLTLAGFLGGQWTGRRLGGSIASLAKAPVPGAPPPDIVEIAAVRQLLNDEAHLRATAEDALVQSERRFRALAEFAPVGIVITDPKGKVLFVNGLFTELFGYTLEDIPSGDQWWPLAHPDEKLRESIRESWTTAIGEAGESFLPIEPTEYPVASRDGSVRHIEFRKRLAGDLNIVIMTDVSRRKAAEMVAQERAEDLRITLLSIGDAVITTNMQGHITRMNRMAEELTGWPSLEAENQPLETVFVIVNAKTGESVENPAEKVIQTGRIVGLANHTKLLARNGSEYQISDSAAPIKDEHGAMRGVVLVFRDVTESYALRETIQKERSILQMFVKYSPAAIAMLDREMRYLAASERFLTDYGIQDHEITGRSHYEIFPEIPERWKQIHRSCLAGTVERCDEDPFSRADGRIDWIRWEIRPWYENSGDIGGILLFSEVITESKIARETLLESERKIRFALETAGMGGWDLNLKDHTVHRSVLHDNIFGYRDLLPEWSHERFLEHVHPDDRSEVEAGFVEAISGRRNWNVECRIYLPDGSLRWIWVTGRPFRDKRDDADHMAGFIQDITDRKLREEERDRMEKQLIQAQKMESVGRLAGGVAHDYNNMLNVILGYTEIALEEIGQGQPLHGELTEVLNAARRSAEITRQLLAFARKQTIAPMILDLNDTITGMLKMLQRLIGENISLSWNPKPGLWYVKMDPSQVDQILANLCVNSRDAIHDVGIIKIETDNASLDEYYCADHVECTAGDYVMLSVSDTGCGMDQESLERVFEPFYTTKGVGKGTGLGMSTVYGIVKQNNGSVNIYSELGTGTAIKIFIPRHQSEERGAVADKNQSVLKGNGEILLFVEDESTLRKMGKTMLERSGYTVLIAASPNEAFSVAEDHAGKISLVITDVVMPEMNGKDLANHLQILYPGIKVLFMSGYTANAIAHHGVLDDGVNFIQKPFSRKDLTNKVRAVLSDSLGEI